MIHGVKYFNDDVLYLCKKHYCPNCKAQLKKVKVSRVVNHKSPEAKDFDFSQGDGYMIGNVKFIWKEFECPECKTHLTVNEMKKAEGIPVSENKLQTKNGGIKTLLRWLLCVVLTFICIYIFVFAGGWKLFESGDVIQIELGVSLLAGSIVWIISEQSKRYDAEIQSLKKRIEKLENDIKNKSCD